VPTVSRLSITPVKGVALLHPEEVELTQVGVPENRRFFLVDGNGKRWSSLPDGPLFAVKAETDASGEWLRLEFPDGEVIDEPLDLGRPTVTPFSGRSVRGRYVEGRANDAFSRLLDTSVRLVRTDDPGGAIDDSPVSILSDASLAELARRAGEDRVDGRRFRMLVHVAGTAPHEEDEWLGRSVRIGAAVVRVTKQDARCRMTTRNPETGMRDFDTLKAIESYRGVRGRKAIDFGVYADVEQPGRVRVGDPVEPL
jgi:uncharacterized protein YcbX